MGYPYPYPYDNYSYDYEPPDYESLSRAYPILDSLVVDKYYGRPNAERVKAVDMLFYDLFGVRDAGKILASHRRSERDDAMKANLIRACGGKKLTDLVLKPRQHEKDISNYEMMLGLIRAYCDISRGNVKEGKRDDIIRFYKKTIEKLRFDNGIDTINNIDMIDNPLKMMKKYLQKDDEYSYGYGGYGIGDYGYGYDRNYGPPDYNYGNNRDYDYSGTDIVSSIFDCLDDDERRHPNRSRRPKGKGKSSNRRREDDDDEYDGDDREPSYVRDLLDAINQLNQNIANQNNDSYDDSFCEHEHQVHFMPDYPPPSQTPPPQPIPQPQPQVVQTPPATEVSPEIKKMFSTLTNSINTLAKRQEVVSKEVGTLTERYNEVADFLNNSYDELEEEESPGDSPGNADTPSDLGRTTGGVNSKTATVN